MENAPEAPAAVPAAESVATPNTNSTPTPAAPDMHGFTSEQLAEMRKFYDNNGGWEKVKSRISNPEPAKIEQNVLNAPKITVSETTSNNNPNLDASYAMKNEEEMMKYKAPIGSITREEFLAQQYFGSLANDPKYAAIADDVRSGAVLKDMAAFNIRPINQDGSINDMMVRRYLDLKSQTVAAKQTTSTPEAGAAPTVDYLQYNDNNMTMQQAMAILQQDSALRGQGKAGNPDAAKAEEFMKKALNPQK